MKISSVMLLLIASAASVEVHADEGNEWRLGVSGGTMIYADDKDPRFASIALARDFENGYVEMDVSTVRGGVTRNLLEAVPVDSETITLSAGRSFSELSLDGHVAIGRRRFDIESIERLGQMIAVTSKGSSFAAGGALTYDIELSDSVILWPFIGVDYDKVDIGRVVTLPGGSIRTIISKEEGMTGSAGASMLKLFGAHAFGVNAAFAATSNSSAARSGTAGRTAGRIVTALNVPGQSEEWATLGATASFALAEKWRLNFNASRSIGFADADATTLSVGASFRF